MMDALILVFPSIYYFLQAPQLFSFRKPWALWLWRRSSIRKHKREMASATSDWLGWTIGMYVHDQERLPGQLSGPKTRTQSNQSWLNNRLIILNLTSFDECIYSEPSNLSILRDILLADAFRCLLRFLERFWQATSNNDLRAVYAPTGRVLTQKTYTHGRFILPFLPILLFLK